jgi:hypothetical protein
LQSAAVVLAQYRTYLRRQHARYSSLEYEGQYDSSGSL